MMSSVIIFLLCAGLASPSDVDPDAAARHRKSKSDCSYATSPVSPVQHTYAEDGLQVKHCVSTIINFMINRFQESHFHPATSQS